MPRFHLRPFKALPYAPDLGDRWWMLALVVIGGLALTGAIAGLQWKFEQADRASNFERTAQNVLNDVEQRMLRCDRLLTAAAVWAEIPRGTSPAAWTPLAQRLRVGEDDWCADAVNWYPKVSAEDLPAFERRQRSEWLPTYSVRPQGPRDWYFPLAVAVPFTEAAQQYLGLDPWADPHRRADMEAAARSGNVVGSPLVRLDADTIATLRYAAVYGGNARREIVGYVGAPIQVARIVRAVQKLRPNLRVALTDVDDTGTPVELFSPKQGPSGLDTNLPVANFTVRHAGREWHLRIQAFKTFRAVEPIPLSVAIILGGVGLVALTTALVRTLLRSDTRAQALAQKLSAEAVAEREHALRAEAQRRLLLDLIPLGVMHIGPDHTVIDANRAAHELLGAPESSLLGRHMSQFHDEEEIQRRCSDLSLRIGRSVKPGLDLFVERRDATGRLMELEWTLKRDDGDLFTAAITSAPMIDPSGKPFGGVRVFADVSDRKRTSEHIRYLAMHDALTGLANRAHFERFTESKILETHSGGPGFALMLLDLDRFKQINDALGHSVGDQVLCTVGERLRVVLRNTDLVARMGGDEFVLVLPGVEDPEMAKAMATKVVASLHDEVEVSGQSLLVTTSIGVAMHPQDGVDVSALMKAADLAMYSAKDAGRNGFDLFDPMRHTSDNSRLVIERDLRNALGLGQFELHYQPLVRSKDIRPHSVEALVRWWHPELGLVSPAEFIPIAEETGLIIPIGAWVLKQACIDLAHLRETWPELRMGVNLSSRQVDDPNLIGNVMEALEGHGLPPTALELEITESVLVKSGGRAPVSLQKLRAAGIGLAVDDFGTGWSALAYLSRFPVTQLKVDRSFVQQINGNSGHAEAPGAGGALAAAVVALGHSMGLHTVAEGVETVGQQEFLTRHGCDLLQGYLFSRPLPLEQLKSRLRELVKVSALGVKAEPGIRATTESSGS